MLQLIFICNVISSLRNQAKLIFRHTWKQCLVLKVQGIPSGKANVLPAMVFFARSTANLMQGTTGDAASKVNQWGENSHDPRPQEIIRSAGLAESEMYPCAVSSFNASLRAKEGFKQGMGFVALCTGADLSPWAQCAFWIISYPSFYLTDIRYTPLLSNLFAQAEQNLLKRAKLHQLGTDLILVLTCFTGSTGGTMCRPPSKNLETAYVTFS